MSTTDPRTTRAESPTRLTRRTLTLGAAWTAPLLAVSVAAPAYAASCGQTSARSTVIWGTSTYNRAANGQLGSTPTVRRRLHPDHGHGRERRPGHHRCSAPSVRDNDNMRDQHRQTVGGTLANALLPAGAQVTPTQGRGQPPGDHLHVQSAGEIWPSRSPTSTQPTGDFWDKIEIERAGGWTRVATPGSVVAGRARKPAPTRRPARTPPRTTTRRGQRQHPDERGHHRLHGHLLEHGTHRGTV